VILHLDLDAFYAQVEHRRLGIDRSVPLAVQQWAGLIAVNYAARSRGVGRFCDIQEAKSRCPDLKLVHVETIGNTSDGRMGGVAANKATSKACLNRYRSASTEVLKAMQRFSDVLLIERASIDEWYIDATALVEERLEGVEEGGSCSLDWRESHVCKGASLNASLDCDVRLIVGAKLCKEIRDAVKAETEYEMSAGISHNKMLSKLASAMNKPNMQTIVPSSAVEALMDLDYTEINGLGGKLGEKLKTLYPNLKTSRDLQTIGQEDLARSLGQKTGAWIHALCRGEVDEPVKPNLLPKSLNACKSFPASPIEQVHKWLLILAEELADRIEQDRQDFARMPRFLVLHARGAVHFRDHSSQSPMPKSATRDRLYEVGLKLFEKIQGECLPCSRLALGANSFVFDQKDMKKMDTYFVASASEPGNSGALGKRKNIGTSALVEKKKGKAQCKPFFAPAAPSKQPGGCRATESEGEGSRDGIDLNAVDISQQKYILSMIKGAQGPAANSSASKRKSSGGQSNLGQFFATRSSSQDL